MINKKIVSILGSANNMYADLNNFVLMFSLYKLSGKAKNCLTVRRASDNATADIGFNNNYIDVNAIENFCAGTNGFVTKWYNQYIYGNHAIQSDSTRQPQIVNAGSIIANGLQFDGTNDSFTIANYSQLNITAPPFSIYFNSVDGAGSFIICKNADSFGTVQYAITNNATQTALVMEGGTKLFDSDGATKKCLFVWSGTGANQLNCYLNALSKSATYAGSMTNQNNINIGARSSAADNSTQTLFYTGNIKTIFIANKNLTNDLSYIKTIC